MSPSLLCQPKPNAVPGQASYIGYDPRDDDFDGLRVGFWKNSTGTLNDSDANKLALTDQLGWQFDFSTEPGTPFFTGYMDLSGDAMADWIGAGKSKACYFAVNLVDGAALSPVFDQKGNTNSVVYSTTDDGVGNGINNLGIAPQVTLPFQALDIATGELYALTRTAPGVLEWTWINQPAP